MATVPGPGLLRSYTKAIGALDKSSQWQKVLGCLDNLDALAIQSDTILFNSVISACGKSGQWQIALELMKNLKERSLQADVITHNALISSCEKTSQWTLALHVFSRLQDQQLQASLVSHSATVSACQKSGQWQAALALFFQAEAAQLLPDVIFYSAAVSACVAAGVSGWRVALELLQRALREGAVNQVLCSAAISACEGEGQWQVAFEIFRQQQMLGLRSDEFTLSALMSCCEKASHWPRCFELLDSFQSHHVKPSLVVHNVAINAFHRSQRWVEAMGQLEKIHGSPSLRPDAVTYSAVITACGTGQRWQRALELFCEAPRNAVVLSATISACEQACHWQHALQLLADANHGSVQRDLVMYNAVISACASALQWPYALHLLCHYMAGDEADGLGKIVNGKTANCAMRALTCAIQWQRSLCLLDRMQDLQVEIDVILLSLVADACAAADQWTHVVPALGQQSVMVSEVIGPVAENHRNPGIMGLFRNSST
eukprot:s1605_g16.t1